MNRISANTLDTNPPLRRGQGRRIQCSKTVLVYADRVEYALHGKSALCAGQQRPAPRLNAPVGRNSGMGQITDLFVLQVCGDGSDDGLGRATGVDFVAFAGGAHANGGGLVIMTDDCEHRTVQTWVGVSARDLADWHARLY